MGQPGNWATSPTATRILEHLECRGPATARALSEAVFSAKRNVNSMLRQMKDARVIHILRWQRQLGTSGETAPVYTLGPGNGAPKRPRRLHARETTERHRRKLAETYGHEVMLRMTKARGQGGADKIEIGRAHV